MTVDPLFARTVIAGLVTDALGRPMSWPDDWCATFAAAGVAAIWSIDLLGNAFTGAFAADEVAALEAHPLGLGVMLARRMRILGWRRVPIAEAPIGAIAAIRVGGEYGHSIGLVVDGGWAVRRSDRGVTWHPAGDIVAAWVSGEDV